MDRKLRRQLRDLEYAKQKAQNNKLRHLSHGIVDPGFDRAIAALDAEIARIKASAK